MDYLLETYENWLNNHIMLADAFSVESLKALTVHMLMGRNYRLITENNTKSKLMLTYLWLMDIVQNAKIDYGDNWQKDMLNDLLSIRGKTPAQKNLMYWLIGLTAKTSVNLGISKEDFPEFLNDISLYLNQLFSSMNRQEDIDNAWLLMMAGSATLNIRGSDKSRIGKQLEKALIRACLYILGLEEGNNFWLNIQRDNEVDRETDAEIATQRGRVRVEIGLISSGNQEVTEDKIGRVGRNGVIIFDKVGSRTRIYDTAERHGVKLIQIRNNQPLVELHRHLQPLVATELNAPPVLGNDIHDAVFSLSDEIFLP
ncbi:MAG: CfrBI family restriction endonuclease [Oscillospiraceae bacterium]|nr:CfrBI family restriction endonuclease [Oscillospiraceae bacterium]